MTRDLRTLIAEHVARTEIIASAYEAATPKDRRQVQLVEYRCPRGCLVLSCWQSPMGKLVRLPGYRLSPDLHAGTAPAAREKRTRDGDQSGRGRWHPRHLILGELLDFGAAAGLALNCDHLRSHVVTPANVAADAEAGQPGKPTRRVIH